MLNVPFDHLLEVHRRQVQGSQPQGDIFREPTPTDALLASQPTSRRLACAARQVGFYLTRLEQ